MITNNELNLNYMSNQINYEAIFRNYKKRERALQRRNSIEQGINKRLNILLSQCKEILPNGLLKDLVNHELKMNRYKYF